MNPDSPLALLDKPIMHGKLIGVDIGKLSAEFTYVVQDELGKMTEHLLESAKAFAQMSDVVATCPCAGPSFTVAHRMPPEALLTPQLLADLRGSASALRRLGWVQGQWITPRGVCGLGAGMVAISGQRVPDPYQFSEGGRHYERYITLATALNHWLGIAMPSFNDRVARSGEQVIEEIEALAFEVERYLCERYGWREVRTPEPAPFLLRPWAERCDEDRRHAELAQLTAPLPSPFTITKEQLAKLFDVPAELVG